MLKSDLEEIAKIENVSRQGTKKELVKRLSKKVRLAKIRHYYSTFMIKREYGILEHHLVPPHRIMSEKEVKELIKKYGLKNIKQIPRILVTDPVMIALGAAKGDVIEITRKSGIAGESKYYRLVI